MKAESISCPLGIIYSRWLCVDSHPLGELLIHKRVSMSTPTFTIESVHGIKQSFVLGPTLQVSPQGIAESRKSETKAERNVPSEADTRGDMAPQIPR